MLKSEKAFFEFMRDYEICPQLLTKSSAFQIWSGFQEQANCVYEEISWNIVVNFCKNQRGVNP